MEEQKVSIDEARKLGVIDSGFLPVVQLRVWGTKARVDDLPQVEKQLWRAELLKLRLADARALVASELGQKRPLSTQEYIKWFALTLGKGVGLIHKSGKKHGYLTPHNITLDCRIVDLDSVDELKTLSEQLTDSSDMRTTFSTFLQQIRQVEGIPESVEQKLMSHLYSSYVEVMKERDRKYL